MARADREILIISVKKVSLPLGSVKKLDTFHQKKHFLHFFLRWCLQGLVTLQRKNKEIINLTQISLKTRRPGPMDMFHTDLTNLTDGKSLRPCLSATPSVSSRMVAASTSCDAAHFVRFVRFVRDQNQRWKKISRFLRDSREKKI